MAGKRRNSCPRCGGTDWRWVQRGGQGGRAYKGHGTERQCRPCANQTNKNWRVRHPELRARYRERGRARAKERELQRNFGLTQAQFDTLLDSQGGVCAICKQPETRTNRGFPRQLSVDHCHRTGKVRGLLCTSCNLAVGNLRDDPALAENLARYLKNGRS